MRRTDAGDSKVTYYEYGREVFKNYKDSSDASHFNRREALEPYELMKRSGSPDPKPNKRFGNYKPSDNLGTSGRVIGKQGFDGIKTDIEYKPYDSIQAHGQIKYQQTENLYDGDYPRHVMTSSTISAQYVPKKGRDTTVKKVQQSSSTIASTLNQAVAQQTNAHEEYLQTFKHAKDIRDTFNSE